MYIVSLKSNFSIKGTCIACYLVLACPFSFSYVVHMYHSSFVHSHTDYDSKTSDRKKVKVSSRPRSASPTTPTCSKPHPFKKSKVTEERGEKKAGGIGDILKGLDIQRLMGSIQKVKEQTEGDRSTSEVCTIYSN